MVTPERERMQILEALEQGEIGVSEALKRLGQGEVKSGTPRADPEAMRGWQGWWKIPLACGLALGGAGLWLASLGGWYWMAAAPSLLLGAALATLVLLGARSKWVHIRLKAAKGRWPRRMALSLPVPLSLVAWGLRTFQRWVPHMAAMDQTALDELLLVLDRRLSGDGPLYLEIGDDAAGEHIQVFLG